MRGAARRCPNLPKAFHHDWLRVAAEETHHFSLVAGHLASLGHGYGDCETHDGCSR